MARPLITGIHGGYDIDLRRSAANGVRLLGHLIDISDGRAALALDLEENLRRGDQAFDDHLGHGLRLGLRLGGAAHLQRAQRAGPSPRRNACARDLFPRAVMAAQADIGVPVRGRAGRPLSRGADRRRQKMTHSRFLHRANELQAAPYGVKNNEVAQHAPQGRAASCAHTTANINRVRFLLTSTQICPGPGANSAQICARLSEDSRVYELPRIRPGVLSPLQV